MRIEDTDLLNYVDGNLSKADKQHIDAAISGNRELLAKVALLRDSKNRLADTFSQYDDVPMPQSLVDFVDEAIDHAQEDALLEENAVIAGVNHSWKNGFALASRFCGVLAVAVVVFYSGMATEREVNTQSDSQSPNLVEVAAYYQSMYSRETVENIQQKDADAEQVLGLFNATEHSDFSIPNLTQFGLQFKRIQPLIYEGQRVLQIVYIGQEGNPIALCVTVKNGMKNGDFDSIAGISGWKWEDKELAYILLTPEEYEKQDELYRFIKTSLS